MGMGEEMCKRGGGLGGGRDLLGSFSEKVCF